jgi:hypothetical protein
MNDHGATAHRPAGDSAGRQVLSGGGRDRANAWPDTG